MVANFGQELNISNVVKRCVLPVIEQKGTVNSMKSMKPLIVNPGRVPRLELQICDQSPFPKWLVVPKAINISIRRTQIRGNARHDRMSSSKDFESISIYQIKDLSIQSLGSWQAKQSKMAPPMTEGGDKPVKKKVGRQVP